VSHERARARREHGQRQGVRPRGHSHREGRAEGGSALQDDDLVEPHAAEMTRERGREAGRHDGFAESNHDEGSRRASNITICTGNQTQHSNPATTSAFATTRTGCGRRTRRSSALPPGSVHQLGHMVNSIAGA